MIGVFSSIVYRQVLDLFAKYISIWKLVSVGWNRYSVTPSQYTSGTCLGYPPAYTLADPAVLGYNRVVYGNGFSGGTQPLTHIVARSVPKVPLSPRLAEPGHP